MKKIGLLVACEIDAVLEKYGKPVREEKHGTFTVRVYKNDAYDMYVIHSGVGEIAAAAAVQLLISVYRADLVVNFGVVGGLTPEMALSKSCIITKVVHYDMDTSALDGIEPGRYTEYPDVYIPATKELVEKALEIMPDLKPVICASADKFVDGPEKKGALHEKYGADICEMEAAAVVLTCNRNNVPCLLIKTVSDAVTGGAEDFSRSVAETSGICLGIADRLIGELE